MRGSVRAYVGLGGNVGDTAAILRDALQALDALPQTRLLRASKLYRTPAWGQTEQADFINAVAALETQLDARALMDALLGLERDFGRERATDGSDRWGPRTLDLDILLYGAVDIDEPGLHLPHPRLHERAFALVPLLEIAPEIVIPGHGRARDLPAAMARDGIEALG